VFAQIDGKLAFVAGEKDEMSKPGKFN